MLSAPAPDTRLSPRERLIVPLAAWAFVSLAYLTPPSFLSARDFVLMHVPYKSYAAESLRGGRLPLWNPYVGLGRPFLADPETAVLYPPNLLYLALDPGTALYVLSVLHATLAAMGTLKLGRYFGVARLPCALAALGYVAGAPLVGRVQVGQLGFTQALAYLPLLLLLACRLQDSAKAARIAALAGGLGLQFLCGHPQACWITWVGLASFLLGRALSTRPAILLGRCLAALGLLAATCALGLALVAFQLLPLLELVGESNRAAPTLLFSTGGSLAPHDWSSLLVAASRARGFHWEFNLYSGLVAALAGACGLARLGDRNVRGLLAMASLGTVVALGTHTPVFGVLHRLVPGLAGFHIHARAGILVSFALILASAVWLDCKPSRRDGLLVALACVTALVLLLVFHSPLGATAVSWTGFLARAVPVLAAGGLLAFQRSRRGAAALPLLLAFALADLSLSTASLKAAYVVPVDVRSERVVLLALGRDGLFPGSGVPPRIFAPPEVVREDAGLLYKWSSPGGYVALSLDRVWTYLHERLGVPASLDENTYPNRDIYGFGPFPYDSMNLVLGLDPRDFSLRTRADPDPRAYVVHSASAVGGWREAVHRMRDGHDFHRTALVERAPAWPLGAGTAAGDRATIVSFTPEALEVEVDAAGPGLLVLAEAWYPGWSAQVDGQATACEAVNGWMRGVPVPPGRHRVTLRYRSRYLSLGAAISLAALALLAFLGRPSRARPG